MFIRFYKNVDLNDGQSLTFQFQFFFYNLLSAGGDSIKVVPESEELVEEDILEDDDKENDRMEDEDYETEEQSGNILSDKTNTLNTLKVIQTLLELISAYCFAAILF